jgi:Rrf2 family protein
MFSAKVFYGLRALVYLAERPNEVCKTAAIAKATGSPPRYIEVILCGMKSHGLVKSRRGSSGGFLLACSPKEISLSKALLALDWSPPTVSEGGSIGLALRSAVSSMSKQLSSVSLAQVYKLPVVCKRCGKRVEEARECYAFPVCYACTPPPEPLPVAKVDEEDD